MPNLNFAYSIYVVQPIVRVLKQTPNSNTDMHSNQGLSGNSFDIISLFYSFNKPSGNYAPPVAPSYSVTSYTLYESQKMYAFLENRAATVKERYLLLQLHNGLLLGALTFYD